MLESHAWRGHKVSTFIRQIKHCDAVGQASLAKELSALHEQMQPMAIICKEREGVYKGGVLLSFKDNPAAKEAEQLQFTKKVTAEFQAHFQWTLPETPEAALKSPEIARRASQEASEQQAILSDLRTALVSPHMETRASYQNLIKIIIVQVLLHAGADPRQRNKEGRTPLLAAFSNQSFASINSFLDAGFGFSAEDRGALKQWIQNQPHVDPLVRRAQNSAFLTPAFDRTGDPKKRLTIQGMLFNLRQGDGRQNGSDTEDESVCDTPSSD